VRAEVTFFGGMVFRIDKDRVVGAGRHARFTTNTDRLVEVDDAIGALEHCRSRAGGDAGCVRTLITASDLMGAASLRENAYINMFDVSTRDREGDEVFRLARRGTRVTTNATRVVNDLGPLYITIFWRFEHENGGETISRDMEKDS
jgi:hypothetical protein